MGEERAAVLGFLDAESASLERHARMVAESHGDADKTANLCRRRASLFRAASALIRGETPPSLYVAPVKPRAPLKAGAAA